MKGAKMSKAVRYKQRLYLVCFLKKKFTSAFLHRILGKSSGHATVRYRQNL